MQRANGNLTGSDLDAAGIDALRVGTKSVGGVGGGNSVLHGKSPLSNGNFIISAPLCAINGDMIWFY